MSREVIQGSTDVRVRVRVLDATTGAPYEGLAHNATGIEFWYQREGATKTTISLSAGSGLSALHSDGRWNEIDNGWYQVDAPDAAFAALATSVLFGGSATGYVFVSEEAALVAGSGGVRSANVSHISGDSAAADNLEAACDGTGYNIGGATNNTAIANAVLDDALSGHATAGTVGKAISDINTNASTLVTRITASLFGGITSLGQWLGLLAGKQTPNSTALAEINATGGGSGTYSATTDSLEAQKDAGGGDATQAKQDQILAAIADIEPSGTINVSVEEAEVIQVTVES